MDDKFYANIATIGYIVWKCLVWNGLRQVSNKIYLVVLIHLLMMTIYIKVIASNNEKSKQSFAIKRVRIMLLFKH